MTYRHALLAFALSGAFLAACKRESDAPQAPVAAPAEEIKSAVISEVDQNSPSSAAPGFDAKAFAGTYAGILPCADCAGIDTTVLFEPEGGYTLSEIYQGGSNRTVVLKGTWTVKEDGKTLLLDPEDKQERDRSFEVASPTELRALDRDGTTDGGQSDYTLRRK